MGKKIVYVTDKLETKGIEEVEVKQYCHPGVIVIRGSWRGDYVSDKNWAADMDTAKKNAARFAARRIAHYEKKIQSLRKWLPSQIQTTGKEAGKNE